MLFLDIILQEIFLLDMVRLYRRYLCDIPGFLFCNHKTTEMFGLVVRERLVKLSNRC